MTLVYVAPVPYSSFAQRPHHMIAWLVERSGCQTLWIDPYPGRLPRLSDLKRSRQGPRQTQQLKSNSLKVISPPQWSADPLLAMPWIRGVIWKATLDQVSTFLAERPWLLLIGRPSQLALHLLNSMSPSLSAYDAMDDFPEFYAGCSRLLSRRIEGQIAHRVNRVLVSSRALRQKFDRMGISDLELLPNGLNGDWRQTQGATNKQPVFGYIGTVGPWFDWALVGEMAHSLPDVQFEVVGPVVTPPSIPLPVNVHLAGECSHDEVPAKLRSFTAGMIPFRTNPLTEAIDPIKYYEYRAAGIPVLSTAFGEMRERTSKEAVYPIRTGMNFRDLRNLLNAQAPTPPEELARFRLENSWRSRFNNSRFLNVEAMGSIEQTTANWESHSSR